LSERPRAVLATRPMRQVGPLLLSIGVLAIVGCPTGADAAFPGANGVIVFQHTTERGVEQADIFTIRRNGGDRRRLTYTPRRNEFAPAWDATGSRLVFWRSKAPFGFGRIWVMDADRGNPRRLTGRRIDAREPTWSPSGRLIAFASRGDLFTMQASDGSHRRRLTSSRALDFEPAWSPDGRRIVFTRGHERGDVGDLFTIGVRTGKITQITSSRDYDHQANWSPDGERIVFERDFDRVNGFAVVVANGDGSHLRRLTPKRDGFFDTGPVFSPTGRQIVFGRDRPSFFADLFVMRANGEDQERIRRDPLFSSFPDWQPLTDG
jgi:Tol biopolymer transport system component